MKQKTITIDNAILNFDPVDIDDPKQWRVIKSESYLPDRNDFVVKCWANDHKEFDTPNAETIYRLCSRSKNLSSWLEKVNLKYVISEAPPDYLKDFIDPNQFAKSTEILNKLSKHSKNETNELIEESKKYKNKVKEITKKYADIYKKETIPNFVKIINLKSNDLPISFIMAIDNFSSAKGEDSPKAKTYARELLLTFKKGLLEFIKDKPEDFNIDQVIEDLKAK